RLSVVDCFRRLPVRGVFVAAHADGRYGTAVREEQHLFANSLRRRSPRRVVFVAAAADGPDGPAVREDQHLCANALRRGSPRRDDGDEGGGLATFERVRDGCKHFLVHWTIIRGPGVSLLLVVCECSSQISVGWVPSRKHSLTTCGQPGA